MAVHQWINIENLSQIDSLKNNEGVNIIFKHSTRCPVSSMAKRRFEKEWEIIPEGIGFYYLDLLKLRDISNYIADTFQVYHESPQLLLIKNGECILDASHSGISASEVIEVLK